jgi:thiol-disulfide isomerase/thioredoxin
MKKAFLSLIVIISFYLTNCSKTKPNEFELRGSIEGIDTGKIILNYVPDKTPILDTAEIVNGKFTFRGRINEPLLSALYIDRKLNNARIFIEPNKMEILLTKDKFSEFKLNGSKSQREAESLTGLRRSEQEKLDHLNSDLKNISDSSRITTDEIIKSKLDNQSSEIRKLIEIGNKKLDSIRLAFILNNPKSSVAAYNLQSMLIGNERISLDSMKSLFYRLDTVVQKGRYGKRISDEIRKKENTHIGAIAPDFKTMDLTNRTLTLSEFINKKIVLLDFWASWCVPCRQNIPHLKEIYQKYNPKGLEIVAISIDNDKNAWVKAVEEEGTNIWLNIHHGYTAFKPGDFESTSVYANYYYNTIPTQILVDFNGKIIGHWVGNSAENNSALDKQLVEILKN